MREPLRVLLIEDSQDDAELVVRELRRGGYDLTSRRVDDEADTRAALASGDWDAVIADYSIPGFGGIAALAIIEELSLDIPFLLVSGSIGEETAVAAMKAGAHDYILKDNLTRLVPALRRELRDMTSRRERARMAEALRFLSSSNALLAETLDYGATLERVSRFALPVAADWCAIELYDERGALRQATIAHVSDDGAAPLRAAAEERPEGWLGPVPAAAAVLPPGASDAELAAWCHDGAHERAVRAMGTRAGVVVPLVARGAPIGAARFGSSRGSLRYDGVDLWLTQEIARRAALAIDNARLYRDAQEAVRARDEFLSIASHELNTPLTPLRLQVEAIARAVTKGGEGLTPDRLSPRLDICLKQVTRLTRLIDSLLDVSRVTAGRLRLKLEDVDLSALLAEVIERHQPELARANCAIAVRAPEPVVGRWDKSRLDQVVSNLVSNAIKFGPGAPVEVGLSSSAGKARVWVRDEGIGLAAQDQARVFGRFERAVSERHYGGFGLGLWISRQIVDAHHGTIRIDSEPKKGATFTVELPLVPPSDAPSP